ncbi:hypothetical protein AB431_14865 [Mycobacterium sp. EPa45]|nr:hypothetical protein AB431_14865 [Mycobacterium sp. EPa45]
MDVWSDWTVIGKTIAALDWLWLFLVAAAVVSGAIGVWTWLTARAPRRPRSARRRLRAELPVGNENADVASTDASHDTFRSAA